MPHAEQLPLQPEQFVPLRPERTIHARSHGDVLARDFELAQPQGHAVGNPCVAATMVTPISSMPGDCASASMATRHRSLPPCRCLKSTFSQADTGKAHNRDTITPKTTSHSRFHRLMPSFLSLEGEKSYPLFRSGWNKTPFRTPWFQCAGKRFRARVFSCRCAGGSSRKPYGG